jgi:PAS domain S-box-containing protein
MTPTAQDTLRQEQEKLRAIVEHALDVIAIKDRDGRYVLINPAGAEIFGRPADQIVGRRDADLFEASEARQTEAIDRQVMDEGKPLTYTRRRTFGGVERTFLNTKFPYRDAEGRVVGLIGIGRDVTDRVKAEEEQRLFRELVDQSSDAIFVTDPQTAQILDVNQTACARLGYEREELLRMRVMEISEAVSDPQAWKRRVDELRVTGSFHLVSRHRRKDGTSFPVEVSVRLTRHADREYIVGVARDITERQRLEEELVAAQRHAQELYDSAPVMLLRIDPDGAILDCNRMALAALGYERGDLGQVRLPDLFAAESRPRIRRLFEELRRTGRVTDEPVTLSTKSGAPIVAQLDAVAGGAETRVALRDITARIRQEQALEEARRQLQVKDQILHAEKLRALGEMLSGVAHELNNPLGAITGFAEMLARREPTEEARLIRQEAERCSRIVNNLLRFARRRPPEKAMVDVRRILLDALELRAYHFKSKGVTVQHDLAAGLPQTWADESALGQVFLNILNNAEDAVALRGPAGQIRVRAWREERQIFISFTDNGSGIPRDQIRQIFDPFFTTKEPGQGTGLGLSVAYGIIQEHRGRITAQSEVGVGTTITVELPVRQEDATRLRRRAAPPAAEVAPSGRRILVVEDEPSMRKLLRDVLALDRHTVVEAADAPAALGLTERESFDLVITDIKMPHMSGRELYEHLRRRNPALARRVIFITGDMLNPATQEFVRTTDLRVLEKPCTIEQIRREVAGALAATGR